eukprot:1178884-Prorocentrum_minimum.AAC.3
MGCCLPPRGLGLLQCSSVANTPGPWPPKREGGTGCQKILTHNVQTFLTTARDVNKVQCLG